jgi:multidrug efflux pump subunit AcrA (membrane-fusion protein)
VSDPALADVVDKRNLLHHLKIDRNVVSVSAPRWSRWVAGGITAITFIVALALWRSESKYESAASAVPGPAATATLAAIVPAAADTSVLDATGYVVARRRATVSAKTTGKVSELFLEEGMRVEEGQLLARLDDSVPRATFALAQSQYDAARGSGRNGVQIRQAQLDLDRVTGLATRNLASKADLDRARLTLEGCARRTRAR